MNTTLALVAELENYVEATQYENAEPLCEQAAAHLRRLHAENEALRRDAERYRWTRAASHDWGICEWDHSECEWVRDIRGAGAIDAAIDAAMKEANHG